MPNWGHLRRGEITLSFEVPGSLQNELVNLDQQGWKWIGLCDVLIIATDVGVTWQASHSLSSSDASRESESCNVSEVDSSL